MDPAAARAAFIKFSESKNGRALVYCITFVILGMSVAALGPSILEFSVQIRSTVTETSYLQGIRGFAYLVGGLCGFVYDRFPGHIILGLGLLIGGAATMMQALATSWWGLCIVCCIQGFSLCFVDAGGNLMLLFAFDGSPAMQPWMQALHFCFALGAFLSPLLLRVVASAELARMGIPEDEAVPGHGAYKPAFYAMAAICMALAALVLFMPSPPPRNAASAASSDCTTSNGSSTAQNSASASGAATSDSLALADADGTQSVDMRPIALTVPLPQAGTTSLIVPVADDPASPWTPASSTATDVTDTGNGSGWGDSPATGWELPSASTASPPTLPSSDHRLSNYSGAQPTSSSVNLSASEASSTPAATSSSTAAASPTLAPSQAKLVRYHKWRTVVSVATLMWAYVGAETAYGFYATAFAVFALGKTEAEGQYLTSGFWGAITIGRLLAVPLSTRFKPDMLLRMTLTKCVISIILLAFVRASYVGVWVTTILYGIGMACVYPTAVALLDGFFPVEGRHATALVLGGSLGEWMFPFIVGNLIGGTVEPDGSIVLSHDGGPGPNIVIWVTLCATILTVLAFVLVRTWGPAAKRVCDEAGAGNNANGGTANLNVTTGRGVEGAAT